MPLLALLILGSGPVSADEDAVARGRALATKHCAVCHVVGDFNKFGGIGSTPSFRLLANMRDGAERFESFFARRPHTSFVFLPDHEPPTALPVTVPPLKLGYDDVKAISAFAATLKRD